MARSMCSASINAITSTACAACCPLRGVSFDRNRVLP